MSKLIPERPRYRKERLWVGYPLLAVFLLLFTFRALGTYTKLPQNGILTMLIALPIALLLPTVVFWILRGASFGRALRLRFPHASHLPLLLCALFSLLCGCILLSLLCGGIDTLGNSSVQYEQVALTSPVQAVLSALALAVLPALLEELFFRGIVVAEYERRGAVRGALLSALFFALCHFDLHNLPVYFFAGLLLVLTLYVTESLLATATLHVLYNLAALFGQRYLNALYRLTGSVELFLFTLILLFILSTVLFLWLAAISYRKRTQDGQPDPQRCVPYHVQFYTVLDAIKDPPAVLCLLLALLGTILF